MKNVFSFSVATILLVALFGLFPGCNSSGDSITTCTSGDLNCLLDSMRLTDPTVMDEEEDPDAEPGSNTIILVTIPTVDLPLETPGDTAAQIPHPLPDVTSIDPDVEQTVDVPFTDPNPCRPVMCYSICEHGPNNTLINCTSSSRCSRSRGDGLTSGNISLGLAWRSYYPPTYEDPNNPTTIEPVALKIQPISDPDCTEDPVNVITGGGQAIGGVGVTVDVRVDQEPPASDEEDQGGDDFFSASQCSGFTQLDLCSYQACVDVSGSSCTAGYEDSHGHEFFCASCSDCFGAAQSLVNHCSPPNP